MYYFKKTLRGFDLVYYGDGNGKLNGITTNPDRKRDYTFETAQASKRSIIDYGVSNDWTHMLTLTFDKLKHDRYDYDGLTTKVLNWLNNYKKRYDQELKFILIPELHRKKDNEPKSALHFHGLLKLSQKSHRFMTQVNTRRNNENNVYIYKHDKLSKSFGFNELAKIYNHQEFITYYISKYITKAFGQKITEKRFYSSQGLSKPIKYHVQDIDVKGLAPDYENQFVNKWSNLSMDDLEFILENHPKKEKIISLYKTSKL